MTRREPVYDRESQRNPEYGPARSHEGRPRPPRSRETRYADPPDWENDYEDWGDARQSRPRRRRKVNPNVQDRRMDYPKDWEEEYVPSRPPQANREVIRPRSSYYHEDFASGYQHEPRRPRPRRPISADRSRDYRQQQEQKAIKKSRSQLIFLFLYNLLFYSVTIGILIMAVLFSISSKSDASIFGYRFYTVLTNSMVPQSDSPKDGFYAGDIIIVQIIDQKKIQPGEIVTFAVGDSGRYLTHRMVERLDGLNGEKGDYIVTKGDANENNDPPIEASRVLGKVVFTIPKVGNILGFIRDEFWLCLLTAISTFGFILVLKAYLFASPEPVRRTRPPIRSTTNY